ncbi:MAG: hypothetical protein KOO62_07185 [candidate division Zixibacteria bacterium]|nr:hypothetical protein [candidate division Zixibacteria bacterium]
MRRVIMILSALVILLAAVTTVSAQTEQDIIDKFLKKTEEKHTKKLSWISLSYTANRINRDNSYNRFATANSARVNTADIASLDLASSFGLEMGLRIGNRIAWTVGGEYWMQLGSDEAGPFTYTPPSGTPIEVSDLTSKIKVYGFSTGINYFLKNSPQPGTPIQSISIRLNSTVGLYNASWDLWNEYENLNLATSVPIEGNTTFKGSAPGISFNVGVDYPLNLFNLALCADAGYFYLNFKNIAWYNTQGDEVVVTYDETADSRVDLNLSGFRGKVEFRRYFQW